MDKHYDTIIIGAGAAGLTAGIYASRANMETILLEKFVPGGQAALTSYIDNYPVSRAVLPVMNSWIKCVNRLKVSASK